MHLLHALTDIGAGHVRYALRAWLIALIPGLALLGARLALVAVPQPQGTLADIASFAFYSILVAPLVETAAMVPFALALLRLPVGSDWPRVVALAALAALAHGFAGSPWAVAAAFWPFVVYAAALFAWRARSLADAYLVSTVVHMLYNAAMFAAGALVAFTGRG